MPTLKFGHLDEVDTDSSGFEIYDGPTPKPGIYTAKIKVMRVKMSKAGNAYFSILTEFCDDSSADKAETVGFPLWVNITPGEAEVQQIRTAQLFRAICGKKGPNVTHEDLDDGGKVLKVGGKDPLGTEVRVEVKREVYEGESRAVAQSILPSKAKKEDVEEIDEVEEDEEIEAEVEEVEEEAAEEDSEDEAIAYSVASKKALPALKKIAKEAGYDASDLKEYKKKEDLLELLVEDGVVEEPESDEEAPF